MQSLRIVSGKSPESMQKLRLFTKLLHGKLRHFTQCTTVQNNVFNSLTATIFTENNPEIFNFLIIPWEIFCVSNNDGKQTCEKVAFSFSLSLSLSLSLSIYIYISKLCPVRTDQKIYKFWKKFIKIYKFYYKYLFLLQFRNIR